MDSINQELLKKENKQIEVRKEDGVATLKGEQPAGPKYIGFDKKFTKIEEIDSERMVAVKAALSLYLADQNRETVTRLIEACDAYCKGRFAFFKAFRRAGVRLAEVKALRAEALHLQEAYTNAKFADNLIYDEEDEYDSYYLLSDEKKQLLEEYSKEDPDPAVIERLEEDIRERSERAYNFKDYLARHYPESKFMDDQWELDAQIAKYRIPYQRNTKRTVSSTII